VDGNANGTIITTTVICVGLGCSPDETALLLSVLGEVPSFALLRGIGEALRPYAGYFSQSCRASGQDRVAQVLRGSLGAIPEASRAGAVIFDRLAPWLPYLLAREMYHATVIVDD